MSLKYYLGREFRVELSCDMSIKFGSLLLARRTIIHNAYCVQQKNKLICRRNLSTLVSNFRLSNGLVDSPFLEQSPLLLHKLTAVSKNACDVAKHSRPILHCSYRTYQIWDLSI